MNTQETPGIVTTTVCTSCFPAEVVLNPSLTPGSQAPTIPPWLPEHTRPDLPAQGGWLARGPNSCLLPEGPS